MLKNLTLALVLIAGVAGAAWAQTLTCTVSCNGSGASQTCTYICA